MSKLYDFTVKDISGADVPLSRFRGQVLLIVNTASKCGFTPQYEGLEALYKDYAPKGFAVLGFPCNQFGHQEPGDETEIAKFCSLTYDVSFPMFAKVNVNDPNEAPLYGWLKNEARGLLGSRSIKWNFTKFLVDRNGTVKDRFAPTTTPKSLKQEIEALL